MKAGLGILAAACISLFTASATAQTAADEETPKISLMLASRAADNDAGRHQAAGATGDANISGRTLGGGLGLGMLGAAVSQSSPYVGMAFGYYGLAWSVYSSVIARGGEVQFDKNAMMDIKFGARTTPQVSKFRAALERTRQ